MKAHTTETGIVLATADSTAVTRIVLWHDGSVMVYWKNDGGFCHIYTLEGGMAEALRLVADAGESAGRAANAIKNAAIESYSSRTSITTYHTREVTV